MSPPPRHPVALTPAPSLPSVGEQFDKYSLLAKLATGGMAELFVARLSGAAGFSKSVVIKRILPHVAHDEHFTRMFLDEAITCAQITHPNVCQVFELCEAQGSHFLVLEHLEGATVGDLIRRCLTSGRQINLRLAAGILVQACDGLHAAHQQVDENGESIGLVHRDVSPGNLFVTVDGIVKVLDFGIAKAAWMSRKTRTGTLLGKCEYMSPEQARGGVPLDRRSDIFSLGIAAWELVCGQRLFRRESEYETLKAVLRAPIQRPIELRAGVPEALDHAIMRALERDPDDRHTSAYEFRQAIADSLKTIGGPTPMCDIAPLIRNSFAEELRTQRALLRDANQLSMQTALPVLRSLPALTDAPPANTSEVTGKHRPLPSLERPGDEEASMELTFRVVPKRQESRRGEINAPALPERTLPLHAPKLQIASVQADGLAQGGDCVVPEQAQALAPVETFADEPPGLALRRWILLVPTALLCAALAASVTLLANGKSSDDAEVSAAKIVERTDQADPAAANESVVSASENAEARAALMAANQDRAVVTQLAGQADSPAPSSAQLATDTGTLTITSSKPGQVFLYPDKELIGTTPLERFALQPGDYKLKVQVGPGEGDKKYFTVKIRAGEDSSRSLSAWR